MRQAAILLPDLSDPIKRRATTCSEKTPNSLMVGDCQSVKAHLDLDFHNEYACRQRGRVNVSRCHFISFQRSSIDEDDQEIYDSICKFRRTMEHDTTSHNARNEKNQGHRWS